MIDKATFIIQSIEARWPNLYMEGWDADEARRLISNILRDPPGPPDPPRDPSRGRAARDRNRIRHSG
jgi:hypothetical protein